jgi:hypothetical protein
MHRQCTTWQLRMAQIASLWCLRFACHLTLAPESPERSALSRAFRHLRYGLHFDEGWHLHQPANCGKVPSTMSGMRPCSRQT